MRNGGCALSGAAVTSSQQQLAALIEPRLSGSSREIFVEGPHRHQYHGQVLIIKAFD